jgi:hypothetical protein
MVQKHRPKRVAHLLSSQSSHVMAMIVVEILALGHLFEFTIHHFADCSTVYDVVETFRTIDDVTRLGLLVSFAFILALSVDGVRRVAELLTGGITDLELYPEPAPSARTPSAPRTSAIRHSDGNHRFVWILTGATGLVVAFILGAAIGLPIWNSQHWFGDTTSAVVIGVSIILAGVVASCFFLLIARINSYVGMSGMLADRDHDIARAERYAHAIRRHRKSSDNNSNP